MVGSLFRFNVSTLLPIAPGELKTRMKTIFRLMTVFTVTLRHGCKTGVQQFIQGSFRVDVLFLKESCQRIVYHAGNIKRKKRGKSCKLKIVITY